MPLRPYQRECLEEIQSNFNAGISRQLAVLATGLGKTHIAAHVPAIVGIRQSGKRMMFIVHLDQLAAQAYSKLQELNMDLSVGLEKAEHRAGDSAIVVASIQTIGRKGGDNDRLRQFNPDDFAAVVCDEVHHGTSPQYLSVFKYLRVLKGERDCDDSKLFLGITATPTRSDNVGLEMLYDKIVYSYPIIEGINDEWLADIEAYRVWTDHDVSSVSTARGDFAIGELEDAINTPERNLLIVRKYQELGEGLPALAFTANVQHSLDLAETFRNEGIEAIALSGKTPDLERKGIIARYLRGELPVLVSCMVISEGADLPVATVGLMARPTKSTLLFTQQIGRILRPYPAPEDIGTGGGYHKDHAIVVDFVDNVGRHRIIGTPSLFGLRREFDLKGRSLVKTVKEVEQLEMEYQGLAFRQAATIEEMRAMVERVELLRPPTIPALARQFSRYGWLEQAPGSFHLSLPSRTALMIRENHLGQFEIHFCEDGRRVLRHVAANAAEAFYEADKMVPSEAVGLTLTTARWRNDPPTEAQAGVLFKYDRQLRRQFSTGKELYQFMRGQYEAGVLTFTKGAVSQRIDGLFAARR